MKILKGTHRTWCIDLTKREDGKVESKIGTGGNGDVFIGHADDDSENFFAIKILKDDYKNEKRRERFVKEIEYLQLVSNLEGCSKYVDHGYDEFRPFIVMEYYPRGTYADRYIKQQCSSEGLKPLQILENFLQAAKTVQRLHHQRIAVRDIKPQNIFLTKDNEPIIGDFGLALLDDVSAESRLTTHSEIGSRSYRAPWEVNEHSDQLARDVWSLGRTLWAIFARKHPPNDSVRLDFRYHLKHSMASEFTELIQSLVNGCHEEDPSKMISIEDFVRGIEDTIEFIKGKDSRQKIADIKTALASMSALAKGSIRLGRGIEREQRKKFLVEDLRNSENAVFETLQMLEKEIKQSLDSSIGHVGVSRMPSFTFDDYAIFEHEAIEGESVQFVLWYTPSMLLERGGAKALQFLVRIEVNSDGELIYTESKKVGEKIIEQGSKFKKKPLYNFILNYRQHYKDVVLTWLFPAIEKEAKGD